MRKKVGDKGAEEGERKTKGGNGKTHVFLKLTLLHVVQ
jgi:hypothetical protein